MGALSLSIVVPAHNEAPNLDQSVRQLVSVLSALHVGYEILIVDDGSDDESVAICAQLQRVTPELRVIRHARNEGYGRAIWDGIRQSQGELVVIVPADLQFCFDELPRLLALAGTHDIVVGRRARRADPLHRRFNAWCWRRLVRSLLSVPVRDINSGFKVYRRSVFDGITIKATGGMVDAEILARTSRRGASIVETDVEHFPRKAGRASGGQPRVILRSVLELRALYSELRR